MKKTLISIATILIVVLLINACKKTGGNINPLSSVTNNGVGSYLVLDKTDNLNLDYSQINTSTVGVEVHYYQSGEAVDHVILFVTPGSSLDTNDWHQVKSIPYTAPTTTLSVTGAELATALGVDPTALNPGNSYTIYTRIVTKSGKAYDVNNTGDNSGSGLISGLAYNSLFFFKTFVVCPYDASTATGKYTVVQDTWTPYATGVDPTGSTVTVTALSNDTLDLSGVWPDATSGATVVHHLVVIVDAATGVATVPGNSGIDFAYYPPAYGDFTATASGSGYIFSCTGAIVLTLDVIAGPVYGDQGNFTLALQKQ
ncbi:MAG TPA: hypothetical protein VMT76_07135 [Puia sp.]|nr:hypothetical protein [Puia sp.]